MRTISKIIDPLVINGYYEDCLAVKSRANNLQYFITAILSISLGEKDNIQDENQRGNVIATQGARSVHWRRH
jgi:hypothetical protein